MSSVETQAQPQARTSKGGSSSRVWQVVAILAILVAVGLGIWAATLKSDLDDTNASSAEAQQTYQQAIGATSDQLAATSSELGKATADLQTSQQALQQAGSESEKQAAEAQANAALAENATLCAKGALTGLNRIFSGPSVNTSFERAAQDVQAVSAQCQATIQSSG